MPEVTVVKQKVSILDTLVTVSIFSILGVIIFRLFEAEGRIKEIESELDDHNLKSMPLMHTGQVSKPESETVTPQSEPGNKQSEPIVEPQSEPTVEPQSEPTVEPQSEPIVELLQEENELVSTNDPQSPFGDEDEEEEEPPTMMRRTRRR